MWFDSHCHLRFKGADPDSLARAVTAGVGRVVCIGTDAEQSLAAIEEATAHPKLVWATVGLHPHDATSGVDSIRGLVEAGDRFSGVVGVGECGLDYHYDHSPRDVQRLAFAEQIALAKTHDLTLVIHTRQAWNDTFDVLTSEGSPARTVFHCFTGGPAEARVALDLGAWISFSGIVTFPRSDALRAAAVLAPLDRILVETDSPYLAPVPHRGRPNEPAYVALVGAAIAISRGNTSWQIEEATWVNGHAAFARRLPS